MGKFQAQTLPAEVNKLSIQGKTPNHAKIDHIKGNQIGPSQNTQGSKQTAYQSKPTRIKQSQTKPENKKPHQGQIIANCTKLHQTRPGQVRLDQTRSNWTTPNQAKPNQTKPNQNQTKPGVYRQTRWWKLSRTYPVGFWTIHLARPRDTACTHSRIIGFIEEQAGPQWTN